MKMLDEFVQHMQDTNAVEFMTGFEAGGRL